MILRLAEEEAVSVIVSPQVLAEVERTVREKAPAALAPMTLLLARSRVEVSAAPSAASMTVALKVILYQPDAVVLAAAIDCEPDYLVTLVPSRVSTLSFSHPSTRAPRHVLIEPPRNTRYYADFGD